MDLSAYIPQNVDTAILEVDVQLSSGSASFGMAGLILKSASGQNFANISSYVPTALFADADDGQYELPIDSNARIYYTWGVIAGSIGGLSLAVLCQGYSFSNGAS